MDSISFFTTGIGDTYTIIYVKGTMCAFIKGWWGWTKIIVPSTLSSSFCVQILHAATALLSIQNMWMATLKKTACYFVA